MDEATFIARLRTDGYGEIVTREWPANQVNARHSPDYAVRLLVLEGEMTVTTDDGATTCCVGDSFALDADIPHEESVGPNGVRFIAGRK